MAGRFGGFLIEESDIAVVGVMDGQSFTAYAPSAMRHTAVGVARRAGGTVHGVIRIKGGR